MANSADPDQLASEEANWSGSTLFAKAGSIWAQQDKGKSAERREWSQKIFHDQSPWKKVAGPGGDQTHYLPITSQTSIRLSLQGQQVLIRTASV